jgi:divergent AAA domain
LERLSHSKDDYVAKVAESILAKEGQGNLTEESRWREDELLELLSLKGKGEEDLVSGNMEEKRTFKNSLVYPVGAKHVDVEAQLDSIMQDMCRFLNNQGGAVYIGMSDKGVPVGIQADLDYLCCNLDKYELFLHQRIKEAFGEEVDRTISIERKQFGDKVVEVLVIPRFDGEVEYHSEN